MHPALPLDSHGLCHTPTKLSSMERLKKSEQAGIKATWERNFIVQSHSIVGALLWGTVAHVLADALCLHFLCLANCVLCLGCAELVAEWQVQESSFQLSGQ